jgi:hypothetical protein
MDIRSTFSVFRTAAAMRTVACTSVLLSLCPLVAAQEPAAPAPAPADNAPATAAPAGGEDHDKMMEVAGGPTLKFRGFADLNLGIGSAANPLIFPVGVPSHTSFQLGEFDLFMTSKLSPHISFVAELVFGSDGSNELGVDLERLQLTYKAGPFFEVSGGRYHTAIGYYNTAFHHGTWFQTALGRPFMDYFEDSGGLLPVHNVGVTTTGLVPGTGTTGLHWIAEVGNGRASTTGTGPVQIFAADRNYKSNNVAVFIKPEWFEGLQVGASSYHDRLYPDGVTRVNQSITGVYAVYIDPNWEFLNEAAFLRNEMDADGRRFASTLMYTQLARKVGTFHPYARFQYVNSPEGDPVNVFIGTYKGPSLGLRYDISSYVAVKAQYNRLYTDGPTANGLGFQVAFTF